MGDQAGAGGGGGEGEDGLEVDGDVVEEGEDGHGDEPVCQTSGGDGLLGEETHGDDGLGGDAVFDVDEDKEGDEREGEGCEDERVRPGDEVAAGVETQEKEDEGDAEGEGAEEVDAADLGGVGLFDGDFDSEVAQDAGEDDERHLDQECPAPADGVVDGAAEKTPKTHASSIDNVADTLPDTALPQGHQIRADKGRDCVQASTSRASDQTSQDNDPFLSRKTTQESANRKESARKHKSSPSSIDIRKLSRQRLERSIGNKISRSQPREERKRVERSTNRSRKRRYNRRIQRREKCPQPHTPHRHHQPPRTHLLSNRHMSRIMFSSLLSCLLFQRFCVLLFACLAIAVSVQ